MEDIFKNINVEKRDRIINSALEEFSKYRFDKASTNNIVKNANISKGLLFHYFASKKELYNKLEEFVMQVAIEDISDNVDWDATDFFQRVKQIIIIKGKLTYRYPYIYEFVAQLIEEKEIDKLQAKTQEQSAELIHKIYTHNINFSMFRNDVDLEKMMEIIRWTFEKFGEELMKTQITTDKKFHYSEIEKEIEQYIEILKKAFYK